MASAKSISEEMMDRKLEEIAQKILDSATTAEEAAQIVREAKSSCARIAAEDVVEAAVEVPEVTRADHIREVFSDIHRAFPASNLSVMNTLNSTPKEYVICLNEGNKRKVLSRHADKEEALAAGKAAEKNLTKGGQYISMISGNISDDGEITGAYRFFERWG